LTDVSSKVQPWHLQQSNYLQTIFQHCAYETCVCLLTLHMQHQLML